MLRCPVHPIGFQNSNVWWRQARDGENTSFKGKRHWQLRLQLPVSGQFPGYLLAMRLAYLFQRVSDTEARWFTPGWRCYLKWVVGKGAALVGIEFYFD